jgi:hypothetical protein
LSVASWRAVTLGDGTEVTHADGSMGQWQGWEELCEFRRRANDGFIEFSWIEAGYGQCLQRRDPWADSTLRRQTGVSHTAAPAGEAADARCAYVRRRLLRCAASPASFCELLWLRSRMPLARRRLAAGTRARRSQMQRRILQQPHLAVRAQGCCEEAKWRDPWPWPHGHGRAQALRSGPH